jgi:hypothetical protein
LTELVREVLQTGLEVETADHLGYERHDPAGRGSGNSRNGSHPKTVTTEVGKVGLRVPRDPNSSFAPVTVRKGQCRLDGLTGNVISVYAMGMTTGGIQAHLAEIYGTEISRDTISRITDAIVEDLLAWQNPSLDRACAGVRGATARTQRPAPPPEPPAAPLRTSRRGHGLHGHTPPARGYLEPTRRSVALTRNCPQSVDRGQQSYPIGGSDDHARGQQRKWHVRGGSVGGIRGCPRSSSP